MNASRHPTIVEYAVRECFKHKTPKTAARITSEKLAGSPNLFVGGGAEVVEISEDELEQAIWARIQETCLRNIEHTKSGMEHVAIAGTLEQFGQKATPKNIVRLTAMVTSAT